MGVKEAGIWSFWFPRSHWNAGRSKCWGVCLFSARLWRCIRSLASGGTASTFQPKINVFHKAGTQPAALENAWLSSAKIVGLLSVCFRLWSNMHDSSPSKPRQYVSEACWQSVQSLSPEETHTLTDYSWQFCFFHPATKRAYSTPWIIKRG